jgi:CheY-like chemotaxis protein
MGQAHRRGRPSATAARAPRRADAPRRAAPTDVVPRRLRAIVRASRNRLARRHATSRAKILVVEQDFLAREALALMLRYYGYEVIVAGDGREATSLLSQVTPDLVVMEWRTPRLSGFSLCLALRRRWPMIPIVVVTSTDEVFDGDQPVNAWLQKPIDPPLLNQVIRNELAPVLGS